MGKIRIDGKTGFAYIPKELREEGFEGDVDYLPNAITLTIIKPGTPLHRVHESLQIVLRDIELRLRLAKDQADKEEEANGQRPSRNTLAP